MSVYDTLKNLGLSKTEIEVCKQIMKTGDAQMTADKLFVCYKTVRFHLTNIYKKLNITGPTKLVSLILFIKDLQ